MYTSDKELQFSNGDLNQDFTHAMIRCTLMNDRVSKSDNREGKEQIKNQEIRLPDDHVRRSAADCSCSELNPNIAAVHGGQRAGHGRWLRQAGHQGRRYI